MPIIQHNELHMTADCTMLSPAEKGVHPFIAVGEKNAMSLAYHQLKG
jgi:hypothetical protein